MDEMKDHTVIHVVPDKVQGEISALYSVPGTHVLFTGPGECARHNCRMHYQLGRISWLCPTDTEIALGKLEGMVLESVGSLVEHYNGKLFGVILYSGCQTEFLNVDFEYLLKTIRNRFHIAAAHHSISRFQRFDRLRLAENQMTVTRENGTLLVSKAENGLFDVIVLSKEMADLQDYKKAMSREDVTALMIEGAAEDSAESSSEDSAQSAAEVTEGNSAEEAAKGTIAAGAR